VSFYLNTAALTSSIDQKHPMTKNKQTVIEITMHNLRFGKDRTPKMAA
jgi:hypothetical protein